MLAPESSARANPLAPPWLEVPGDANELARHVWPSGAGRADDGVLTIAGHRATELAERYGTPLYVVDEADARGRARRIRTALEGAFAAVGGTARVYYAGKAFLSTGIARWMREDGLNLDVASGGELAVALRGGMPAARIGVHGNNKSDAELRAAVEAGVGAIVLDSLQEVARLARISADAGRVQAVRIRVNSGVHASTHAYLATAHEDQKFGIPLAEVDAVAADVRGHASLRFLGLHTHIGSQIFDGAGFRESARRLLEAHARLLAGGDVPELNLGGGFGIAYTAADRPRPIEGIADDLARFVADECARLGVEQPTIAFEPGRAIIGPAGLTIYRVGTTKPVTVQTGTGEWAERLYVSVDGGMSDNVRPALYDADYTVRLGNRATDAKPALVRVAGKHCESGDLVVLADYLPGDVRPGDLAVVPATGAYCFSLASNYNWLERPGVLALREGEVEWLIRPETIDDLLARDPGAGAARDIRA
ncbi:diaminopimelate decarboxylase [Pseudoclavibacter endophyticus]|uniref:Diaminopimelate decarboxylase n=1 Tax=Pseudoclavibacter endophyticus TaxID=1778590 RepID=A0A6H9WFZ5_9MICO|nr:diaminopimelate decarboxylase [Pseudoclavibacter endophyticus]KAB1649879.1 diaminopimelate decarboxylase [Pseudoclavibacter endophyticus]GGA59058.1 diaminopimelate decarboxylase [Pseudoclavibacter endophyticus]